MTCLYEYRVEFDQERDERDSEIIETIMPPVEGFEDEIRREYPDPVAVRRVVYVGRVA